MGLGIHRRESNARRSDPIAASRIGERECELSAFKSTDCDGLVVILRHGREERDRPAAALHSFKTGAEVTRPNRHLQRRHRVQRRETHELFLPFANGHLLQAPERLHRRRWPRERRRRRRERSHPGHSDAPRPGLRSPSADPRCQRARRPTSFRTSGSRGFPCAATSCGTARLPAIDEGFDRGVSPSRYSLRRQDATINAVDHLESVSEHATRRSTAAFLERANSSHRSARRGAESLRRSATPRRSFHREPTDLFVFIQEDLEERSSRSRLSNSNFIAISACRATRSNLLGEEIPRLAQSCIDCAGRRVPLPSSKSLHAWRRGRCPALNRGVEFLLVVENDVGHDDSCETLGLCNFCILSGVRRRSRFRWC